MMDAVVEELKTINQKLEENNQRYSNLEGQINENAVKLERKVNILQKRINILEQKIDGNQYRNVKSLSGLLGTQNIVFQDDSKQCSSTALKRTDKIALDRNEIDGQEVEGKSICF